MDADAIMVHIMKAWNVGTMNVGIKAETAQEGARVYVNIIELFRSTDEAEEESE